MLVTGLVDFSNGNGYQIAKSHLPVVSLVALRAFCTFQARMTAESTKFESTASSILSENNDEKIDKRPSPGDVPLNDSFKGAVVDYEYHGSMKAPPVCVASELKDQSMSSAELVGMAFECTDGVICPSTSSKLGRSLDYGQDRKQEDAASPPQQNSCGDAESVLPISSTFTEFASSLCSASSCSLTRDCDVITLSDTETKTNNGSNQFRKLEESEKLNARIVQRKDSRQGRASQRWVPSHESSCGEPVRLVVGTVPILKGGKILFISASRKPEWILPKGGWEGDESMEESAVRESFEEAGVVGILGQPLSPIQYETRKSIKRKSTIMNATTTTRGKFKHPPSVESDRVVCTLRNEDELRSNSLLSDSEGKSSDQFSDSQEKLMKPSQSALDNQTSINTLVGPAFGGTYSHVKMTLFPLYVTNVMESWPESGRFRTAVQLEDAIMMMDSRPEFKAILKEVQALGLHLTREPT